MLYDAKLDYDHVEFITAQNEKERLQSKAYFIKETRKLADDVKNSAGDKEAEKDLEGHIELCYL